jgi:hypothetical protein
MRQFKQVWQLLMFDCRPQDLKDLHLNQKTTT